MMRFRIREDLLHPEYLESYLHSHVTRRHLERHASGTSGSMVKIAKRTVETLAIPLPPLADQRRIAAGLATWDLGIEVVRKLVLAHQQLLGGTRARLLAEAAGNSSVWTQHLGGIATVKKGEQLNKTAMTDRGQYYVLNGGVAPSGRTDRANVAANTVTVSEGGNSCGFVQFNVEDFWCGGHCYALLEVDRSVEVRYLYHYLKARQLRLMGLRTGSGLPNIQKRDLEAVVVAVPPVQEQRRIVDCLDAIERKRALIAEIGRRYGQQKAILSRALLDPSNGGQR
jgi:type I restriction enzyme S subunit